jgi:hypothetical protein
MCAVSLAGADSRGGNSSPLAVPPSPEAGLAAFAAAPFNVSASPANSRSPALAVSDNTVHVLWEESGRVYHRFCRSGLWSSSRSVATGEQPSVVVDASGVAHLVLVNEFGGNYEIYYCRWSGTVWTLPRNVSNTSGVSSAPALAIASDGTLHVVWADNTPGYNVIYHGYWNGTYWLNEPIPYAMGGAPTVEVSKSGVVRVAWQDRDDPAAPYEVYHSQFDGKSWSLPENLSDSATGQSIIPTIAVDDQGQAHVLWQERVNGQYAIYYTYGRVGYWSVPERVSQENGDAYLPSVAVGAGAIVYAGWDEGTIARYRDRPYGQGPWTSPTTVLSDSMGVADLQLAMDASGQFHACWSKRVAANNWDVFYQRLSARLVLPVIMRRPPGW